MGLLHKHIGPSLKGLFLSMSSKPGVKEQLQKCFDDNTYDSVLQSTDWPKKSMLWLRASSGNERLDSMSLDVPKTDLLAVLAKDVISKMVRI